MPRLRLPRRNRQRPRPQRRNRAIAGAQCPGSLWNYNHAAHFALPRVDTKMKRRGSNFRAVVAVAGCVLSGCASVPPSGVEGGASEVKVYESNRLAASQYDVVRRIWVDSWRSNFVVPTYRSEADAIASLQTEATRFGANGLINVVCLDQGPSKWSSSQEPRILCYGNAIRVRQGAG